MQIFISYSHNDFEFVQRLKRFLQRNGLDIWIDYQSIRAGEDWGDALQHGLDASDQMVLVVTPAAMHSRRVRAEWRYFLYRRKRVIPVLLKGPEDIMSFELLDLQYINLTTQPEAGALDQLLAEIRRGDEMAEQEGFAVEEMCDEEDVIQAIQLLRPPALHPQSTFVGTGQMINRVQQKLWIGGITSNKILACDSEIATFLGESEINQLRFLIINRELPHVLQDTAAFVGRTVEDMDARLISTESNLRYWIEAYPTQVEVRRLGHRPSVGYFIADPDISQDAGIMTVSPYFANVDRRVRSDPECKPPFLYLEQRFDEWWFDIYLRDFQEMWNLAEPWPAPQDN